MKTIHILNPVAGMGKAMEYKDLENVYVTQGIGDTRTYVRDVAEKLTEDTNFAIYGGDGTISDVCDGVVRANNEHAYISLVPTGTGNDLVRSVELCEGDVVPCDIITVNDRVSANAINTGFDLDVVKKVGAINKNTIFHGSMAYIIGVIATLFGKFGTKLHVSYVDKNGEKGEFTQDCLLAVVGNGKFYGGGFMSSPAAKLSDGFLDLMVVKKVSRLKFIKLIAKYKNGLHIDVKNEKPANGFEDYIFFKKCKSVIIEGINSICFDGEVIDTNRAEIGILPSAVKILKGKQEA